MKSEATAPEAPSLLLVEDEEAQRRLLAEILRKKGWTVKAVESGEAALASLNGEVPDLVLCDWRMPGISGDEVLAEVRRRELHCAFIVMTAYGSITHAVEAIRRGADDYLSKPFERDALLLAVTPRPADSEAGAREHSVAPRGGRPRSVRANPGQE
jgi:two-component system NtrC family response regulator